MSTRKLFREFKRQAEREGFLVSSPIQGNGHLKITVGYKGQLKQISMSSTPTVLEHTVKAALKDARTIKGSDA